MNYEKRLEVNMDSRGELIEAFRFPKDGQVFFITSEPGSVRGNHYHLEKIETFLVVVGEVLFKIRNLDNGEVTSFIVKGKDYKTIVIPPRCTHSITNIGLYRSLVLAHSSTLFDRKNPDTYNEVV
jgi:UDP-2-acetamido-2,6-beta-L-arabino-hexul-4-ose reductase